MGYQPYFVGPIKVGLERDLDSYLIPEDAFQDLENAYLWRGRVYKKGGYQLLGDDPLYHGRIGIRQDYLAARGAPPDIYAGNTIYAPIEPGSLTITDGITTFTDNGIGGMIVTSGAGINGTINYATGAYVVTFTGVNAGAAVTARYFVVVGNSSPVMGLRTYDVDETIQPTLVAFDETSAYQFDRVFGRFDHARFYKNTVTPVAWIGGKTDFFHSASYQGALFATNNLPGNQTYIITLVTAAANAVITTSVANNLSVGDYVYINNITTAAPNLMNNKTGRVTVAGNPFTTDINTAGSGAYVSGGIVWSLTHTRATSGDGIRWFDGFAPAVPPIVPPAVPPAVPATGWVNFTPPLDASDTPRLLQGCLMLFPYKNYLIALNTVEGTTFANRHRFAQRARWSQFGTVYYTPNHPTDPSILPATYQVPAGSSISGQEWYDGVSGRGGFIDAPTSQDIMSAEFIKDTLIVYFETSTYKLTYTGNGLEPFIWEKINTSVGATSTFSAVPFDTSVLSVGNNGIYGCDSVNIDRIDRIIPDVVFNFRTTQNANKQIYGIRDFYGEACQWTFIDSDSSSVATLGFPDKTLYYNYLTQSYSIFINTFTCFGYFTITNDLIWSAARYPWQSYQRAWDSFGSQAGFPIVVSGNQQGFVFQMQNANGGLFDFNDFSLVIQNITNANPSVFTVPNHNLIIGAFVFIDNAQGVPAGFNGKIYQISGANYTANTFSLNDSTFTPVSLATYTFGGQVSIVDNINVTTKNLNPFYAQGKSMRLGYADFFVDNESELDEITVYSFQDDTNPTEIPRAAEARPMSLHQFCNLDNTKFWRRVHFQLQSEFIKLRFSYSSTQIFNVNTDESSFVLHGMILWMKPTGRLLRVYADEGLS